MNQLLEDERKAGRRYQEQATSEIERIKDLITEKENKLYVSSVFISSYKMAQWLGCPGARCERSQ